MRIGLLSFEYPPDTGFGGIGSYTWYHARALARLGHEVHVLAGSNVEMPLCTLERNGVAVHRFWSGGIPMRMFGALGRWKWWWSRQRLQNGWSMYGALKTLQARHRFDLLEMPECGAEGLLINHLVDVPTIVRFHSPSRLIMPLYDVKAADISLCSWLEQRAIRGATALTSCSAFLAGEVRSKMGVSAPVQVIPNGIDLDLFDRERSEDVHTRFNIPGDKITIFFAGRVERRKGIHLCGRIAEAILRDYDVNFVFAGQDLFGYMSDTLLPSFGGQPFKGSIQYLGKLALADVRSCLRMSDIFLLPSLWENFPYSCLEAMAAGRAIVASRQGGVPEMIDDGSNGLLAASGDPESFIAKLRLLLDDGLLRNRIGEAARRTVQDKFTDECVARQSVTFYDSVIKSSRQHRGPR